MKKSLRGLTCSPESFLLASAIPVMHGGPGPGDLMQIRDLKRNCGEGRARVSATVVWEDCDRPVQEVFFETDERFAESLTCNPHAFLVGCAIPAMHYGEKRVFMDAEVCPEFKAGLNTAMNYIQSWFLKDQPAAGNRDRGQKRSPGKKEA